LKGFEWFEEFEEFSFAELPACIRQGFARLKSLKGLKGLKSLKSLASLGSLLASGKASLG
jgi:hypothetical protein